MKDGGASHLDRYLAFREGLWSEFAELVRRGGVFPELVADPDYILHHGEDLIVATGEVTFEDADGVLRRIEPDILDLYWLSEMLDHAR